MFISKKRITFAVVIEISRHIEILLLSNDCVIVPGLGGFMAHHVNARYEEDENLFLPPLRTLGFNPQLKLNDSLLVQSYIETYDISYPEALRRIEEEVDELKLHISNEGSYYLPGIGTLSMNSEGNYIFSPCEAGILSPELYALPTFEFPKLASVGDAHVKTKDTVADVNPAPVRKAEKQEKPDVEDCQEAAAVTEEEIESDDALIIKLSWIRNAVAVAAAVLMFILMTTPIVNSEPNLVYSNLGTSAIFDTTKKIIAPKPSEIKNTELKAVRDSITSTITAKSDSVENTKPVTTEKKEVTSYCLVFASYISKKNANTFVEKLHKAGFPEAEVYVRNNVTRVVYGNFQSMNDAYNRLNKIKKGNKDFEDAWVLKTTDRG